MGEASARAALARADPAEWPRVIELLQQTNGVFQCAASTNASSDLVAQGYLLLSEAQLATKDYHAAEETLQPLAKRPLSPKLAWQWQYLLWRIQLADGRTNAALQSTTNLLAVAASAGQTNLLAESAASRPACSNAWAGPTRPLWLTRGTSPRASPPSASARRC